VASEDDGIDFYVDPTEVWPPSPGAGNTTNPGNSNGWSNDHEEQNEAAAEIMLADATGAGATINAGTTTDVSDGMLANGAKFDMPGKSALAMIDIVFHDKLGEYIPVITISEKNPEWIAADAEFRMIIMKHEMKHVDLIHAVMEANPGIKSNAELNLIIAGFENSWIGKVKSFFQTDRLVAAHGIIELYAYSAQANFLAGTGSKYIEFTNESIRRHARIVPGSEF